MDGVRIHFLSRTQATPGSINKPETACHYVLCDLSVDGYPVRREFMTLDHIFVEYLIFKKRNSKYNCHIYVSILYESN